MANYFILAQEVNMDNCAIYESPDDFPNRWYPAEGIQMGTSYPVGFKFRMSDDVPGLNITDVINNALGYLMVSGQMKKLLEEHATADIEFLRFTLLNHKGRVASDDCFIANIIGTVDCVDRSRTIGEEDPLEPGQYDYIARLFLLEDKIDPELNLFRIASFPRAIILREDLKDILVKQGITGAEYFEIGSEVELE